MYHYLSEDTIELSQIDRKRETEAQCQLRYLYVFVLPFVLRESIIQNICQKILICF